MAVLCHVLQLIGGWIEPLVIFFVKRQSRFVTFHALQVLLFQGLCLFLEMFVMQDSSWLLPSGYHSVL